MKQRREESPLHRQTVKQNATEASPLTDNGDNTLTAALIRLDVVCSSNTWRKWVDNHKVTYM